MLFKYMFWVVRIRKNNSISNGKLDITQYATWKALQLLFDVVLERGFDPSDFVRYMIEEKVWVKIKNPLVALGGLVQGQRKNPNLIKMPRDKFKKWRKELDRLQIFFNEASKVNLREAGAIEVILSPNG